MISYLYRYEEGVKGKNTGYVRIEQQGVTCRLTLQLQDGLSALPEVWIFHQTPQGVEKLTVGRLQQSSNGYRCRLETSSDNVFETGQPLSQMDGLIVYLQDSLFYGTTWNDISIQLGKISTIGNPRTDAETHEAPQDVSGQSNAEENLSESRHDDSPEGRESSSVERPVGLEELSLAIAEEVEDISTETTWENVNENPIHTERNAHQSGLDAMQHSSSVCASEAGIFENPEAAAERPEGKNDSRDAEMTNPHINENTIKNEWELQSTSNVWNRSVEQEPLNTDKEQQPSGNSDGKQDSQESDIEQQQSENCCMGQASLEKTAACGCEQCRYCARQSGKQNDVGSHIMSLFPKMYPFELETMGECVRLDLKDLGCLPVKCWSLAGNPFLLHGYYCYRHIIFTKQPQSGYCVGVPGIYNRENQEWAEQCGMKQFQPLSEVAQLQGAFGYWLNPLKL